MYEGLKNLRRQNGAKDLWPRTFFGAKHVLVPSISGAKHFWRQAFLAPSFLMIGVWPIIMALSMYFQQQMSPQPADEVQAQVMKMMPLIFLFLFSSFPAGLLIYWSWNNLLSIVQQSYINKMES